MSNAARSFRRFSDELSVESPYLAAIRAHPLLSAAEERDLAGRIAAGDLAARDRLVECNLRLVVKMARPFMNRGMGLEDLVSEGNFGLFRAATDFDPTRGTRFATYATWWIRHAIRRALIGTTTTIRLPEHTHDLLARWNHAEQVVGRAVKRKPDASEVDAHLKLNADKVLTVGLARRAHGVMMLGDEDLSSLGYVPREASDEAEAHEELANVLGNFPRLKEQERVVLMLRYGLDDGNPLTLEAVGVKLGVTRERIRQVANVALRKLRAMSTTAADESDPVHVAAPRDVRPATHHATARVHTGVCAVCGVTFQWVRTKSHAPRKTCGEVCRRRVDRRALSRPPVIKQCVVCLRDYECLWQRRNVQKSCSNSCRHKMKSVVGLRPRACEVCGATFTPDYRNRDIQKACGKACRERLVRTFSPAARSCVICKADFLPCYSKRNTQKACGKACRSILLANYAREQHRLKAEALAAGGGR